MIQTFNTFVSVLEKKSNLPLNLTYNGLINNLKNNRRFIESINPDLCGERLKNHITIINNIPDSSYVFGDLGETPQEQSKRFIYFWANKTLEREFNQILSCMNYFNNQSPIFKIQLNDSRNKKLHHLSMINDFAPILKRLESMGITPLLFAIKNFLKWKQYITIHYMHSYSTLNERDYLKWKSYFINKNKLVKLQKEELDELILENIIYK
jgi:hypothetical protein